MGIFDFIKDVGEKLGIGGGEDAPDADALKKEVEKHGLEASDLKVEVDGDKVKVAGAAPSGRTSICTGSPGAMPSTSAHSSTSASGPIAAVSSTSQRARTIATSRAWYRGASSCL